MTAAHEDDQAALLERGGSETIDSETVLQGEKVGRPHTSMSVSLVSIDEERSGFSMKGRTSFVWRISGLLGPAELQQLLHSTLSSDAQARCCELIAQMLELLRDVIAQPSNGYSADRFHPTKPIPKMRVPDEPSFFYDYRLVDKGGEAIHIVKFLMSSGQQLMAERWGELGQAEGPYIISEAAYQFMRLFTCESMNKLTQPMMEIVAEAFLQWGIKAENFKAENFDAAPDSTPGGDARAENQEGATDEQIDTITGDDVDEAGAKRPKNKRTNGKGKKGKGGNGQGKQGNPYKRNIVGQPGYSWYTGSGGPQQQQARSNTVVLDLFKDMKTELKPHEWQLLYYPVDQCTALDIGAPTKISVTLPETLELDDFPLDRQLLNIRFGASVPPTSQSVFSTESTVFRGHVGEKYLSFLRYKVEEHLMVNEEWKYFEPVEILEASESASPPHFAIRLERKLARSIQTIFVPQFLIVSTAGTVVGFEMDELSNRLGIIMMLLFSSVALSQIAIKSHRVVPYATKIERYTSLGIILLTMATLEVSLVAHVDMNDLQRSQTVERYFYSGVASVWLLFHVTLLLFGDTDLFRSKWQTLAEAEAAKEAAFTVKGGAIARFEDGKLKWVNKPERLFVGSNVWQ